MRRESLGPAALSLRMVAQNRQALPSEYGMNVHRI